MAMVHPIFSVLITRPELVMDHVAGYAALVQEEASTVGVQVARRAAAWAVAAVGLLVFLILAGVACMIGATSEYHWALIVVPAVPLVIAIAALLVARKPLPSSAFTELRAQLDADAQALRTMGAS
jgi:peptidoglycan/LPS O-acetylase OafA/YrhL